ncbi:hypothetical protein [Ottowia sp.]|uniref:hypothetical protein n=1 Tax=Ottowia sp. TaxID=1898956 RepID=UPI003A84E584
MTNEPVGPGTAYPLTWSFSDGIHTFDHTNSAQVFGNPADFYVTTDAAGTLISAQVYLMSPSPPHSVGQTVHMMLAGDTTTFAYNAATCSAVTGTQCTGTSGVPATGYGSPGAGVVGIWTQSTTAAPGTAVAAVPTLGGASLAFLVAMVVAGTLVFRRFSLAD